MVLEIEKSFKELFKDIHLFKDIYLRTYILLKVLRRWLDTTEENITDLEEFSSWNNPNRNTDRKASFKFKKRYSFSELWENIWTYEKVSSNIGVMYLES